MLFCYSSVWLTTKYFNNWFSVCSFNWQRTVDHHFLYFLWQIIESGQLFAVICPQLFCESYRWIIGNWDKLLILYMLCKERHQHLLMTLQHTPPPAAGERRSTEGSNVCVLPLLLTVYSDHISTLTLMLKDNRWVQTLLKRGHFILRGISAVQIKICSEILTSLFLRVM